MGVALTGGASAGPSGPVAADSDYRAALDYLFRRTTGAWKFGLERTEALLRELGDPHLRLRVLHIAGTNGKGSVAATLDALLQSRGLHVGKYTSPHLVDFRERILIDGEPVGAEAVTQWVHDWTPVVERLGATFFEATTAMAFAMLADANVDAAVVETGLGGRLDSTNVVDPVVAGVVSIGIDHTEYLGTTREEIAGEKAGIFKRGVPAVIGEPDARIAALLADKASQAGSNPIVVVADRYRMSNVRIDASGTSFELADGAEKAQLRTPLIGRHQAPNAATAIAMLRAVPDLSMSLSEIGAALADVRLPGRFHHTGEWVFDVAHNRDGAAVLAESLRAVELPRPMLALLSVLGDKDWRGIISELAPIVDGFVLTNAPTAPASRAWRASEALAFVREQGWRADVIEDFDAALAFARANAATTVVTGSFHTVGDAMARLQVNPLAR